MNAQNFVGRLLAAALLIVGGLSLHRAYRAFAGGDVLAAIGLSDPAIPTVRLVLFGLAGVACGAAALWLWSGRSGVEGDGERATPRFGRGGLVQPSSRSLRRGLLAALPVVVIAALIMDAAAPWNRPQDAGIDKPPPAIAAPSDPAPPTSPGPETALPDLIVPPELSSPPAFPPPESAPPQVAAPVPEAPPQTTAPLRTPPSLPTDPDGHHHAVVWLAVSPDGRTLMSASIDRTVKLWDLAGRRLIRVLGVHNDMARVAVFLPDGVRALTCGDDGEIVLRAIGDGTVLHVFSAVAHGSVRKVAVSRDGRRAVSVHEAGTVIVWDIDKGAVQHVLRGHDRPTSALALSPDGSRAVSGGIDGSLKLWDVESGRLLRSWLGHGSGVYDAVFTADGRRLLTASGDATIKLWDVDSASEMRRFDGHSRTVYALALSADGTRVLSGSLDGTARLWDIATGRQIAELMGHEGPVYAVAFSADGSILTGGEDRTIRQWPATGGQSDTLFAGAAD